MLLALFEMLSLSLAGAYSARAQKVIDGLVKPPLIDRHNVRFTRLAVNGESLQSRIRGVVQDDYGFLWFGTSDGLYKYDGYRIKAYRHERGNPNSPADDSIMVLYKDRDGIVWIGSNYGGLDRLDPSRDTFTHSRHESGNPASLSDDYVTCIYRDRSRNLWVGTGRGLDRLEQATGTFVHFTHKPGDPGSLSGGEVNSVYEDRRGHIWVGTTEGLNKLEPNTDRFSHFLHDPANPHSIGHNYVAAILEDRSGVLWVASSMGSGLSALDAKTGEFTRYSFQVEEPSSQSVAGVNGLFEDRAGSLWLCTIGRGLIKFDRERKAFTRYAHEVGNPHSLPNDTVYTVLEDAEGLLWVGTQSGISRFQGGQPLFVNYKHEPGDPNSLRNDMIWSAQADSRGFLWIGNDDGLNRLDQRTGQISFYQHDPKNPYSLSYNKIAAIREDRSGTLWFGTYGGGLDRFDRTTGRFFAYRHDPGDSASLSNDSVLSLLIDRQGTLWVGTQGGGLNRYDSRTGHFTPYSSDAVKPGISVTVLFEDRAGILWAGTPGQGLIGISPGSKHVAVYRHNSEDPQSLSNSKVNAIREDRRGRLWVGTQNGLNLLDRSDGTADVFTTKDGLPDNAIESILEDTHGYLWLGTHNGLSRFDPQTRTFHNYSESDGLAGNLSNPYGNGSSCQTPNGQMVFGSSDGVTAFYPERIFDNPHVPPVLLTDFLLFNKPVQGGRDAPLRTSIWAAGCVTLTHQQSIFTLEFAALSYMAPERNRYRYRLEELESQWNEVDSGRRSATYTNLAAGKYLFRVQGSNNDGIWNSKGVTLAVTVLPPWWATWWFRSVAGLLIVGLIWVTYRSRVKDLQLQTTRLEVQVAQRTRELQIAKNAAEESKNIAEKANRAKSTFLATMSHELRTPLNSILGFSALVRDDSDLSEKHRKDLDVVNRGGEHLLLLIDDVLDMAKIEAGRMTLDQVSFDLEGLVRDNVNMLRERARGKGLDLFLETSPQVPRLVRSDAGKLRQVLVNLVGNALKYTERGSVTVRVDAKLINATKPTDDAKPIDRALLLFEVEDTGVGIAPEDQLRIFVPFVQVGKLRTQKGTGLGLSITQQFLQMMGGTISLESNPGEGSLFRVELPVQLAEESEVMGAKDDQGQVVGLAPGQPECRILIIEDKKENWLLLERLLRDGGFQVQVAEDGEQGVEIFRTWRPHLIWMDLRLPVMGGLEAAEKIRHLSGGQQVKIVALSASVFARERQNVLAAGLDDFVRKPYRREEIFDCIARHLGVHYLYKQRARTTTLDPAAPLQPEALARLPKQLRQELADALVRLDAGPISEVVGRVSDHDSQLGGTLAAYTKRFAYTQILNALENSNGRFTGGSP